MQNRIVGRIHMAGLSHRSRSDDAAEPKFQIPKTDQNYGEQQSHNWYLKEYYILYYIYNIYCLLRKNRKKTKEIQQKIENRVSYQVWNMCCTMDFSSC